MDSASASGGERWFRSIALRQFVPARPDGTRAVAMTRLGRILAPFLISARRLAADVTRLARFRALCLVTQRRCRLTGPIVVYQPGKVGSRSVYLALKSLRLPHPVYHAHFLTRFDELERAMKADLADPAASLGQIAGDREVLRALQEPPDVAWNVITLVRDPVARNISTFFQTLDGFYPEVQTQYLSGAHRIEVLHQRFLEIGFNQVPPDRWFDEQLKPVTGIDVFAAPFPREQGYVAIRQGRFTLLLMRVESLKGCATQAVWETLGIPHFRVPWYNTAKEKWYKGLHREFIDSLVLPERLLALMYDSRMARHFYSPTELTSFRNRWTRGR